MLSVPTVLRLSNMKDAAKILTGSPVVLPGHAASSAGEGGEDDYHHGGASTMARTNRSRGIAFAKTIITSAAPPRSSARAGGQHGKDRHERRQTPPPPLSAPQPGQPIFGAGRDYRIPFRAAAIKALGAELGAKVKPYDLKHARVTAWLRRWRECARCPGPHRN